MSYARTTLARIDSPVCQFLDKCFGKEGKQLVKFALPESADNAEGHYFVVTSIVNERETQLAFHEVSPTRGVINSLSHRVPFACSIATANERVVVCAGLGPRVRDRPAHFLSFFQINLQCFAQNTNAFDLIYHSMQPGVVRVKLLSQHGYYVQNHSILIVNQIDQRHFVVPSPRTKESVLPMRDFVFRHSPIKVAEFECNNRDAVQVAGDGRICFWRGDQFISYDPATFNCATILSRTDITAWSDYRLVVEGERVRFYHDDEVKHEQPLPENNCLSLLSVPHLTRGLRAIRELNCLPTVLLGVIAQYSIFSKVVINRPLNEVELPDKVKAFKKRVRVLMTQRRELATQRELKEEDVLLNILRALASRLDTVFDRSYQEMADEIWPMVKDLRFATSEKDVSLLKEINSLLLQLRNLPMPIAEHKRSTMTA